MESVHYEETGSNLLELQDAIGSFHNQTQIHMQKKKWSEPTVGSYGPITQPADSPPKSAPKP